MLVSFFGKDQMAGMAGKTKMFTYYIPRRFRNNVGTAKRSSQKPTVGTPCRPRVPHNIRHEFCST